MQLFVQREACPWDVATLYGAPQCFQLVVIIITVPYIGSLFMFFFLVLLAITISKQCKTVSQDKQTAWLTTLLGIPHPQLEHKPPFRGLLQSELDAWWPQQPQRGATRGMLGNRRIQKHQVDLLRLLHIQTDADSAVSCS